MLTPKDIENSDRKSGYRQVTYLKADKDSRWHGGGKPYKAYAGRGRKGDWKGPRRATAEEAAQDYCDYVNGLGVTPTTQPYPQPTIDMGNITEHQPKRKGGRAPKLVEGPRDLYDVLFYDPDDGLVVRRKVGITARGLNRYTGICKMMGLSLKPNAEPVTYPSESAARVAEDKLVADICRDKNWKRVAKECFAPVERIKA